MELGSGSVLGSLLAGGLPPSHLPLNAGPHRRLSTLNASLESTAKIAVTYGETLRPMVTKTILAHSVLHHNYRTCFSQYLSGATCVPVLRSLVLTSCWTTS